MQASILPGTLWRESEFVGNLTGACGPNALAMAESWAEQQHIGTLEVYQRMRAAGRCDANGPATIGGIYEQAVADGFQTHLLGFREPMPAAEWRDFFALHVGARAVVMETANGQALRDTLSGQGENARNLKYHFIVVCGWHPGGHAARAGRDLPPGWWCADGDNFAAGDVLQFYPDTVLAAAQPCAALAIAARTTGGVRGGSGVAGFFERLPDGRGKDLRTGELLGAGFADYCLARNVQQKCIKGETDIYPGVTAAFFDGGLILYYKEGSGVSDALGGYLALGLFNERNGDRAQLAARTSERDAAEARAAALAAQLAEAKAEAHPTAGAESAQQLVRALRAALAG